MSGPLLLPRRAFLSALAAGSGALATGALPRIARAGSGTVAPQDRRFVFVTAMGGWDPAMVFTDVLGSGDVSTEPEAERGEAGGLVYVRHHTRPAVQRFFEAMADRVAVLNGVYVSSISHGSATRLFLTGSVTADKGDWPTLLAAARRDDFLLPYLLVGGPGFAGPHGVHVARVGSGGQLQGLLDGSLLQHADVRATLPSGEDAALVDAWLAESAARRAAQARNEVEAARLASFGTALDRAMQLEDLGEGLRLTSGSAMSDQIELAIQVLSQGLSRCVQITSPVIDSQIEWDTHSLHFERHGPLLEGLFGGLDLLAQRLGATPGVNAPTLAEETVVVVLSEMGRTPALNGGNGKDHWPYTSAMMWGPGVRGGQVVGAFDDQLYGMAFDPTTGLPDDGGVALGINLVGATLLELGGVSTAQMQVQADPIEALLS